MGVNGVDAMKSAGSTSLRGQMGLRSGPLAPTSAKLTTQYLVLDHMTSHYSKISKAKPAIDNRPPKSMTTSQKARDRKTRDHVAKTGQRPMSGMSRSQRPHTTTGYYQDDIYDENLWGEVDPEDEEEALIHNIMRTTLRGNNDVPTTHTPYMNGNYENTHVHRQRPSSARSHRSMASGISRTMVPVQKKGTYDGDLLEKRSHVFTEEKPFTPRTLKTDRKSRLSQYKYYNKVPPKDGSKGSKPPEPVQTVPQTQQIPAEDGRPQPKPRQRRLDQTREGPVTMNSLMFETLQSRDFNPEAASAKGHEVPKLDISMDTDHLKWVKEQASRAESRNGTRDSLNYSIKEENNAPLDTSVDFGKTGEMSLTYGTLGSTKTRPYLGRRPSLSKEDEEQAYVKFMHDVTTEVLNRGIFTDRSLRQVFKVHINQNKDRLDELRMRQITDDIRHELNIPRYDIDDDTSFTMTKETSAGLDQPCAMPDRITKLRGQDEMGLTGSMENSLLSRVSKVSTEEQSHDTYNFKSTEDEELYSTIRSDANNTLSDTQALKTYQTSILEQEQEGEEEEEEEQEEGEVRQDRQEEGQQNGSVVSRQQSIHGDEEEGEDYDDDYEDDGDDEDDDDAHTTEQSATYRTDDDDF